MANFKRIFLKIKSAFIKFIVISKFSYIQNKARAPFDIQSPIMYNLCAI